jgi:hypothetical protein
MKTSQEPVAWMTHAHEPLPKFHRTYAAAKDWGANPVPLYTAPQPQPKQEPMTPREIAAFVGTHEFGPDQLKWFRLGEASVRSAPQPQHDDSLTAAYMLGRADDTALLRQALGALEKLNKDGWILADFEQEVCEAIDALKERLK